MKIFECKIGDGFMHEDELPEDLPQELYDWWHANSHVDGVRIGPIITTPQHPNKADHSNRVRCKVCGSTECKVVAAGWNHKS